MTKVTQVAAAVIQRPDGSFLLGRRAPGTFYPGYWEFPGGKVEPGETPRQALVRELAEELGIQVLTAYPWLRREHVYEHAHVRLHFFRVTAWRGELVDHVHTALAWQRAESLDVGPMLPANGPILNALGLPDMYAVTDAATLGIDAQLLALARGLESGLKLVQIREPGLDASRRSAFAHAATDLCHQYGARVLVNGDVELAIACAADGVHLPAAQLKAARERPPLPLVGASCHTAVELAQAGELGADFAVLGPVKPTQSHPGQASLGWEAFAALAAEAKLPLYAIGGLARNDLESAWTAGAHGIAAIRSLWSDDA